MDDLGTKIRTERLKKPLTLKQLSEKTKLSISFLSEIERGVSQPSMASLRRISQALGISLLSFREDEGNGAEWSERQGMDIGRYHRPTRDITDTTVVRAGNRKKIAYPGRSGFYELLTPDLNRKLEVLYIRMEPGFDSGPPFFDPPGEKCLVIIKGKLAFKVSGKTHTLDAGDSISYPADAPVSWRSETDEPVEAILIITPPGF
ncbi:MAG: XRE family transcriptional regulator [Deltaproteobacteria bacterium]|nr:XRE family transcriptional regulator [Deltaproteobacteria bacterium]